MTPAEQELYDALRAERWNLTTLADELVTTPAERRRIATAQTAREAATTPARAA